MSKKILAGENDVTLVSLRTLLHKADRGARSAGSNLDEECKKAGADGFRLKPTRPDELIRILTHAPWASTRVELQKKFKMNIYEPAA